MNNFIWKTEKISRDLTVFTSGSFKIEFLFNSFYDVCFAHAPLGLPHKRTVVTIYRAETFEDCEKFLKNIVIPQLVQESDKTNNNQNQITQ